MSFKKGFKWGSFFLITASLAACSSGHDNANSGGGASANTSASTPCQNAIAINSKPGWLQCPLTSSSDGQVTVSQQMMSNDEQSKTRQQYVRTSLLDMGVDPKFNATIFKISGPPEYANKAFIAPRIYAYGSQAGGGSTSPKENSDGTMTISFNVIFVDGLSETIPGPDGSTTIGLPSNFQVQHPDELRQYLKTQTSATDGLGALPGCPKQISIKVADQEYDASAPDLNQGDYCQLNTPTVVSVRLLKSDAQYMLETGLYYNLVDVHATYETRVSYPIANVAISFNRSSIFDALKAELAVKVLPYADIDVQAAVTHVMKDQMMKVQIQGDTTGLLDKLIPQVTAEFFDPFVSNPADTQEKCPAGVAACFHFSYTNQTQSDTMTFNWDQSTNAMTGQNYETWAKLAPFGDTVHVGQTDESCGDIAHPETCSNFSNKNGSSPELMTVVAGNLLVITPDFVVEETRSSAAGSPVRVDNNVCLAQHEIISQRCTPSRNFGEQAGYCTDVHTGQYQCDKSEDHWVDTTTYSGSSGWELISQPVGMLDQLFGGLTARFTWTDASGKSQSKDCPLSVFNPKDDGKTLQVHLENTATCQVFTGNPGENIMLHLINDIHLPEQETLGQLVTRWDGTVLQSPQSQSFDPEVKFTGTVSVRGFAFQGSTSSVER